MSASEPTTPPAAVGDFAADTAVTRLQAAPGWYTAELPPAWNFLTPSGGVLMALALRAMRAELGDPDYPLVSATTLFCSPVPHGPLEIRVQILRKGGAAAQVRAELSSTALPGPGLEVSATFARRRQSIEILGVAFPDVPMPDQAASLSTSAAGNPHSYYPFFKNFECREASGPRWWEQDWQAGPASYARWFRYLEPRAPLGDRLAIPPIADTMPPALISAVGPSDERLYAPSLDLTVHFIEAPTTEWLLARSLARRAWAGYATAEVEIWSSDRRLIAYGAQTMMLRSRPKKPAEPSEPTS